ncbi:MAG: 2-dehydro-3-deoxy-6-phosphogalactonate aldolase [Micrococcaceae bacterium]|nr:2-dehydro-3-deoxy-6-phosphogalactonate aldolase [Micrococcaceae bacterium]
MASPKRTQTGLVAILRGLPPEDAAAVGKLLYAAGFRSLEVPLNSPEPLKSIGILRAELPADCVVGAGTVLTVEQVEACRDAGAQIIVSPNTDLEVIKATVAAGMESFPGAATPSEAFAAIAAGARNIKIFPVEQVGLAGYKAWRAVLPADVGIIPVGGINAENMDTWVEAGATGFGIASALYAPGRDLQELNTRATAIAGAWNRIQETRKSA